MRQKLIALVVLLTCSIPASALAARVFGDIKMDGKPLPEGVPVKVSRPVAEGAKGPAPTADSTATDKYGSYKLVVKEEGKCALTILYEKQALSIDVFSNKEATRYDLVLEKKDGKLTLRRK
jgi:hypothetical protein